MSSPGGEVFYDNIQDVNEIVAIVSLVAKGLGWLFGLAVYGLVLYRTHKPSSSSHMPSKNLILPVYRPAMLSIQIIMLIHMLLYIGVAILHQTIQFSTILLWSLFVCVCEGFTLILLQGSVGYSAQGRALASLLGWIFYAIIVGYCATNNIFFDFTLWAFLYHFIPSIFHAYIAIPWRADVVAPKRQTLRAYATWMWLYRFIYAIFYLFQYFTYIKGWTNGVSYLIIIFFLLIIVTELPFVSLFYAVLIADTRYWHLGGRLMSRTTKKQKREKVANISGFDVNQYLSSLERENQHHYNQQQSSSHFQGNNINSTTNVPQIQLTATPAYNTNSNSHETDLNALSPARPSLNQRSISMPRFRGSMDDVSADEHIIAINTALHATNPIQPQPLSGHLNVGEHTPPILAIFSPAPPKVLVASKASKESPIITTIGGNDNESPHLGHTTPKLHPNPALTTQSADISYRGDEKVVADKLIEDYLDQIQLPLSLTNHQLKIDINDTSDILTTEPMLSTVANTKTHFTFGHHNLHNSHTNSINQADSLLKPPNTTNLPGNSPNIPTTPYPPAIDSLLDAPPITTPTIENGRLRRTSQYGGADLSLPGFDSNTPISTTTTLSNTITPAIVPIQITSSTPQHGTGNSNRSSNLQYPPNSVSKPLKKKKKSSDPRQSALYPNEDETDSDSSALTSLTSAYHYQSDDSINTARAKTLAVDDDQYRYMSDYNDYDDESPENSMDLAEEDDDNDAERLPMASYLCCSFACLDMLSQGMLSLLYADEDADEDAHASDGVLGRTDLGVLSDANDDIVQGGLQDLIEQNSGHLVHYLQLHLDHSRLLGAGSYSKVFGGELSLNSHQIRERRKYIPPVNTLYISFNEMFTIILRSREDNFWIVFQDVHLQHSNDYSGLASGSVQKKNTTNQTADTSEDLGYNYGGYRGRNKRRKSKQQNGGPIQHSFERTDSNMFTTANQYDTYFNEEFDDSDDLHGNDDIPDEPGLFQPNMFTNTTQNISPKGSNHQGSMFDFSSTQNDRNDFDWMSGDKPNQQSPPQQFNASSSPPQNLQTSSQQQPQPQFTFSNNKVDQFLFQPSGPYGTGLHSFPDSSDDENEFYPPTKISTSPLFGPTAGNLNEISSQPLNGTFLSSKTNSPTVIENQTLPFITFIPSQPVINDVIRSLVYKQQQQQLQSNLYKLNSSMYSTLANTPLVPTKSLIRRMSSTQSLIDFLQQASLRDQQQVRPGNNVSTDMGKLLKPATTPAASTKLRPLPLWRHVDQIAMLDTIGLWSKQYSIYSLLTHQQLMLSQPALAEAQIWLLQIEGHECLRNKFKEEQRIKDEREKQTAFQRQKNGQKPLLDQKNESNSLNYTPLTLKQNQTVNQLQSYISFVLTNSLLLFRSIESVTSLWTKNLGVKTVPIDEITTSLYTPALIVVDQSNIVTNQSLPTLQQQSSVLPQQTGNNLTYQPSTVHNMPLSPHHPRQSSSIILSMGSVLASPGRPNRTLPRPNVPHSTPLKPNHHHPIPSIQSNHNGAYDSTTISSINSTTGYGNQNDNRDSNSNTNSTSTQLVQYSTTGTQSFKGPNQRPIMNDDAFINRGNKVALPIAAKFFLRTAELDIATVRSFSQETILHASLKHTNVVWLYGLCVVPPAISIISEECRRGCLIDLIEQQIKFKTALLREIIINNVFKQKAVDCYLKTSSEQFKSPQHTHYRTTLLSHYHKSQNRLVHISTFLWSLRDRLCLAKDCAAGIAYIHKKKILHRDIKTPNYLLTDDMRVKLTDFGISRHVTIPFEEYYTLQSQKFQEMYGVSITTTLITNRQRKQIMIEWLLQQKHKSLHQNHQKLSGLQLGFAGLGNQPHSPSLNLKRQAERLQAFTTAANSEETIDDDEIALVDVHTSFVTNSPKCVVIQQINDLSSFFIPQSRDGHHTASVNVNSLPTPDFSHPDGPSSLSQTTVNKIFNLLSTSAEARCDGNGYRLLQNNPVHVDFSTSEAVLYHLRQNLQRVAQYTQPMSTLLLPSPSPSTPPSTSPSSPLSLSTSPLQGKGEESFVLPLLVDKWSKYSALTANQAQTTTALKPAPQPKISMTQHKPTGKATASATTNASNKSLESIPDSFYGHPMFNSMNFTFQTDKHFLFPIFVDQSLSAACQTTCQQSQNILLDDNITSFNAKGETQIFASLQSSQQQLSSAIKQYSTYRTIRQNDLNMKRTHGSQPKPESQEKPNNIDDLFSTQVGSQFLTSNMGTAVWMAPEVWMASRNFDAPASDKQQGTNYSYPADIYSLGIVLYELLCLQPPPSTLPDSLDASIYPEFQLFFPPDIPFYVKQLILSCLSFDPNKRPSSIDVVNTLTIFIELIDAYHLFGRK